MPYASGETPVVGDYVQNKWGTPGTVSRAHKAWDGHEDISVRWDDGGTDPLVNAPLRPFQSLLPSPEKRADRAAPWGNDHGTSPPHLRTKTCGLMEIFHQHEIGLQKLVLDIQNGPAIDRY